MGYIFPIIIFLVFCIVVGAAASNRGRFGFGYFLLSLILTPLITFIILIILGNSKKIRRERIREEAEIRENVAQVYKDVNSNYPAIARDSEKILDYNDTKKCPFCAENIKTEAKICRFCNCDLPEI